MRKFILFLAFLLAGRVAAQTTKAVTVTSTTSTVSASASGFFATLCENSATPTAISKVTPQGSTVAATVQAGGCYTFSRAAGFPFSSGTILGTISSTAAGPFPFILTQYPTVPAMSGGVVQPTTCLAIQAIGTIKPDGTVTCVAAGDGGNLRTQAQPLAPGQIVMSPYCNARNVNNCYNTPANTIIDNTCSWNTGSPTVNCKDAPFTAADTGKNAMGWTSCAAFNNLGGTGGISDSVTRTITYVSSTQVTLSANPTNNSGANACLVWGNADDAAADLIDTAITTYTTSCPHVELAAGNYWFEKPHFFSNPPGCVLNPALVGFAGATQFGNIFYAGGFRLSGHGRSATTIYIGSSFPGAGACTHGASGGAGSACFVRVIGGQWDNFTITGGGNMKAPNVAGKWLIYAQGPGAIQNFNCINWGGNSGNGFNNTLGIVYSGWERWFEVDNSGCGTTGINALAVGAGPSLNAVRLRVENSAAVGITLVGPAGANGTPNFTCYDCGISGAQFTPSGTGTMYMIYNANAANMLCQLCNIQTGFGSNTVNQMIGFSNRNAGGVAVFRDSNIFFGNSTGALSSTAIEQFASGNVTLQNVNLRARASGKVYTDVVGSKLFNQGGVVASQLGGGITLNGKVFADVAETQTGTCLSNAAIVTFNGTYSFAPLVIVAASTSGSTGAQVTAISTTTATIHCNGTTDTFTASVIPNPF